MLDCRPSLKRPVLLITKQVENSGCGGRELLSKLNHDALKEIYGEQLIVFELSRSRLTGMSLALSTFKGHIDGLGDEVIDRIVATVTDSSVGRVFIDGSNLGTLALGISRGCPQAEVTTFFHNCEARFFLGALRQKLSFRALGVLVANYLAERRAVRFSDKRICLSERDSDQLRRLYGRGATHVSAMAMRDELPAHGLASSAPAAHKYALFVGGAFYANLAGIGWFCRHVAPHVSMKTCVIGRGLGIARRELERNGNVEVVGEVEDLAPWYREAHVVVAPIFDGSGMKTKVAEALMFGKRIIGTPEAFSGYEEIAGMAGAICVGAADFVSALEHEAERPFSALQPELRTIYEDRYSFHAASLRLCNILGSTR